jgi:hypothetical protein
VRVAKLARARTIGTRTPPRTLRMIRCEVAMCVIRERRVAMKERIC